MKLASPYLALVACILAAGTPAQAAMIYLDCKDPTARNAFPLTWVIDTDAATARPIAGNWGGVFGDLRFTPTQIKGDWRSQTGNMIGFDLNRISGSLEIVFFGNPSVQPAKLPETYRLQCAAMDKPRI